MRNWSLQRPSKLGICSDTTLLWVGAGALGLTTGVYLIYHQVRRYKTNKVIKTWVAGYLDSCNQGLRQMASSAQQTTSQQADYLTSLSTDQLISMLEKDEIKSVDLLHAFQSKALEVHEKTNCLTEAIKEAESLAKECDGSERKGRLHGLPVSLKEVYALKGYSYNRGTPALVPNVPDEDCVVVQVLKSQGAVPFTRTNSAQLGLGLVSENTLHGETLHPVDPTRTPGGSSGGEAALIAGRGSVIGFASDIGGSIRQPAAFCGVAGLRPSTKRVSNKGMLVGQSLVPVAYGPISIDVNGLVEAMKAVLVPLMYQLDNTIPPLPFRQQIYDDTKPLKIGYYTHDGIFPATPACVRVVEMTRDVLKQKGHELVPWTPPRPKDGFLFASRALVGDGGALVKKITPYGIGVGKVIQSYADGTYLASTLRMKIKRFLWKYQNPRLADMYYRYRPAWSVSEWWDLDLNVQKYRHEVMKDWTDKGLDAVLCPVNPIPAAKLEQHQELITMNSYVFLYNVLDLPAGSLPVSKVTKDDIEKMADYKTGDPMEDVVKETMVGSEGLPLAVQCVTMQWQEEMCLRIMKEIETGIAQKPI